MYSSVRLLASQSSVAGGGGTSGGCWPARPTRLHPAHLPAILIYWKDFYGGQGNRLAKRDKLWECLILTNFSALPLV